MQNFVGVLEYMESWKCDGQGIISANGGIKFETSALPMLVDEKGELYKLGHKCAAGDMVFSSSQHASDYLTLAMKLSLIHI